VKSGHILKEKKEIHYVTARMNARARKIEDVGSNPARKAKKAREGFG